TVWNSAIGVPGPMIQQMSSCRHPFIRSLPVDDYSSSFLVPASWFLDHRLVPHRSLAPKPREPLILWWMPLVALLAPLIFAAWEGASAHGHGFRAGLNAAVWPGLAFYAAALAVLWAGWKIELE